MQVEGMDVMPILEDNLPGEERTLYWRSTSQHAVRKGPWKLIRSKSRKDGNEEHYELFNIDQDPSETENLSESHPEIVQTLTEEMVRNIALDAE
jgi:arylsulfatase A-like enzyme